MIIKRFVSVTVKRLSSLIEESVIDALSNRTESTISLC